MPATSSGRTRAVAESIHEHRETDALVLTPRGSAPAAQGDRHSFGGR
jgi:hypothetical protein